MNFPSFSSRVAGIAVEVGWLVMVLGLLLTISTAPAVADDSTEVGVTVGDEVEYDGNETVTIWTTAVDTSQSPSKRVANQTITVTVTQESTDQDILQRTVTTDSTGVATIDVDLSKYGGGEFDVRAESEAGNGYADFIAGDTTSEVHWSNPAFVGEQTNFVAYTRDGTKPKAGVTKEINIDGPNGDIVVSETVTTDEDGFTSISFRPQVAGRYSVESADGEYLGSVEAGSYAAHLIPEYDATDQTPGGTVQLGGFLYNKTGLVTNQEFSIAVRNSDTDTRVTTLQASTNDAGLFTVRWNAPNKEIRYELRGETPDGQTVLVEADRLNLREPSSSSRQILRAQINPNTDSDIIKPGETATLRVEARENGTPIANQDVTASVVFQNYNPDIPIERVSLTTNEQGVATTQVPIPDDAPLGTDLSANVVTNHDGETYETEAYGPTVQTYTVDVQTQGGFSAGEENTIVFEATDPNGNPVANVPVATTIQYGKLHEVVDTAAGVTGSDGTVSTTLDLPADVGALPGFESTQLWANTIHRYRPDNYYRSPRLATGGSKDATLQLRHDGDTLEQYPEVSVGDQLTLDFETSDGSTTAIGVLSNYESDVRYDIGQEPDALQLTVPSDGVTGYHEVRLLAVGDDGDTYTATANIRVVRNRNVATFDIDPGSPVAGQTVTFDASDSTIIGTAAEYRWQFGDGSTETTDSPRVEYTYDSAGAYDVRLTVVNETGATDSSDREISVGQAGSTDFDVTLDASPDPAPVGESLRLNATSTAPAVKFEWINSSGTIVETTETGEFTFDSRGSEPGNYSWKVIAYDGDGKTATDTTNVTLDQNESTNTSENFTIQSVRGPTTVSQGDDFSVSTTISNPGDSSTTESVSLRVDTDADGEVESIAERNLTLNSSENASIGFVSAPSLQAGAHEYSIATANDSRRATLDVVSAEFETAFSTGDPHIVTFDGASYDFMAAGDYILAREPQGDLLVVARQAPIGDSISNNNATATRVGDARVVIDAEASTPVSINGDSVLIERGERVPVDNGAGEIRRQGSTYTVYYAGEDGEVTTSDEHLSADVVGDRLDIELALHPNRTQAVEGLFGSVSDQRTDIAFANGTALARPLDSDVLYGPFRADWRATGQANPFATDYFDADFPRSIVTIDDLSETERERAAAVLADTCLEAGTPQYRDALLDVALTGDSSYVASACQVDRGNVSEPSAGDGFIIDSVRGPSTLSQGKAFAVSATITNTGATNSSQPIALAVDTDGDGSLETLTERTLEVTAGEGETIGFTAAPSLEAGTYPYAISTENDTRKRQFEVVGQEYQTAVSTGDPHLVTFDDVAYDFQAAGEYVLVREPNGSLEIQARQVPMDGRDSITVNSAVATTLDDHTVVIDARDATPVEIDGTQTQLGRSETVSVGNGTIERSGNSYSIVYPGADDDAGPDDERLTVDRFGDRLDLEVNLHPDRAKDVTGILGNVDDNSSNDLALANGRVLSESPSSTLLYGQFREDWRVTEDSTLFTYEDGNGPETYFDPQIPRDVLTVDDLGPDARAEAEQLAEDAGLEPDTAAFRNAVLDYVLTGDESYFASAKQQDTSSDVDQQVEPETPPELQGSNTLTVTAENASGVTVEDAEIVLYNETGVELDGQPTDSSGEISWSTLVTDEYNVKMYGPDGEFWATQTVTVSDGSTSVTLQRETARLSDLTLSGNTNDDGEYYGGQFINISPTVQGGDTELAVRVNISIDTDTDDTAEVSAIRGNDTTTIAPGAVGHYGYDYDPTSDGIQQVRVVTQAQIDGDWVTTDDSDWSNSFEVQANIVGYDPQNEQFDNVTTEADDRIYPSSIASLPEGIDLSAYSPPNIPYNNVISGSLVDLQKEQITSTRDYPWSAVGSYEGYCTGTVIDNRHVITAAHCIFDKSLHSLPPENAFFAPGRDRSADPLSKYNVTFVQTYKRYIESDIEAGLDSGNTTYDLAILTLNESVGKSTGTYGYRSSSQESGIYESLVHLTGYPSTDGSYVDTEDELWNLGAAGEGTSISGLGISSSCTGTRLCHDVDTGAELGLPNSEQTLPGQSGGPVWRNNVNNYPEIVSVMSQGSKNEFGLNNLALDPIASSIGVRITDRKYSDIGQMVEHGHNQVDESDSDPSLNVPDSPRDESGGAATGDPHFTTFDGVSYDFQAAGEFVLTRDSDDSPTIQARFLPVADRDVSVVSAVATQLGDRNVTIDARDDELLTVDGATESLSAGDSTSVGDGEIYRTQDRYIVVYPGADGEVDDGDTRMEVTVVDDRLDVVVEPNRTAVDSMSGLLGSPNGDASDDIVRADGTALTRPLAFEELYGQFREDWRVTSETTLFDYETGNGPGTYYDPEYPSEPVTVDDLDGQALAQATTVAQNAGLEPGTAAYRDAVIDYALTEDRSFVDSATRAADATDVSVDTTSSETDLTAPEISLDANELVTEGQSLSASFDATHTDPGTVTVLISNGTDILHEQDRSGAFESEQTFTWDGTIDGEQVEDGAYLVGVVATSESGVGNVSSQRFVVDTTAPEVTANTSETTVEFQYSDAATGIDSESITVQVNGTDVTDDAQITASNATYIVTDIDPGETRSVELEVTDNAGLAANQTVAVTAAESDDEADDGSNGNSDTGGSSGGSGGGSVGGGGGGGGVGGGSSPAVFDVTASVDDRQITPGESVTATVTVSNVGQSQGTFDLVWRVDNRTVNQETYTIGDGETRTLTLNRTFEDSGDHTFSVSDRESVTVEVNGSSDSTPTQGDTDETPTVNDATEQEIDTTAPEPTQVDPAEDPPATTTTTTGPGLTVVGALVALLLTTVVLRRRRL